MLDIARGRAALTRKAEVKTDPKTVHYFAYGSNMSLSRFRQRVPSGQPCGVAVLHGHVLAFHKHGVDGSAKCGIVDTGNSASRVYGVVYALDLEQLPQLDLAEGNGYCYQRKTVEVDLGGGSLLEAQCYFATDAIAGSAGLLPYGWYREHARLACSAGTWPTSPGSRASTTRTRTGTRASSRSMRRARSRLFRKLVRPWSRRSGESAMMRHRLSQHRRCWVCRRCLLRRGQSAV